MISLEMHLNQNLRKLSILIGDNMKILHVAETIKGGIASHLDEILPYQIAFCCSMVRIPHLLL